MNAIQRWSALCCSQIEFFAVSLCNLTLYTTSQLCMQCLKDPILWLVAVQWIIRNAQSALLYWYFRLSIESDHPAVWLLPPCQIQNLGTPCCSRLWYLPKIHLSSFVMVATLIPKSSSMLGGLQWMYTRSSLLLWIFLDMRLCADFIYTAEWRRPAAQELYVSFGIKFFAIHQNMGLTQWGNTCWEKLISQS